MSHEIYAHPSDRVLSARNLIEINDVAASESRIDLNSVPEEAAKQAGKAPEVRKGMVAAMVVDRGARGLR